MLRTDIEGEHFLHRVLWLTVKRQAQHADSTPTGAMHDHLVLMVFSFHALEAYLNFVGGRLDPEFWKDERKHFRASGFAGKLRKVFDLSRMSEPDKNTRPYYTIWELKNLRDLIAHATIEKFSDSVDHPEEALPMGPKTNFDRLVTPENARRALEDVESFAQSIHDAAHNMINERRVKGEGPGDVWFGDRPFSGPLRQSGGHTYRP